MKWFIVPVLLLCSPLHAAPWWQPLGPIEKGAYDGGHCDQPLNDTEKKAATAKTFNQWTTYEDDFVRFKYPSDPSIKLQIIKEGQPVKVEGGVCTSVDNSFHQAYILKVGAATYGVFLLNPSDWLDDGICLCGPMVHHAYSMREGCLVRYSLLTGHAVKKAQWLGGGLRLMAFEWTHLACPREIYQGMIDSMVLKLPANRSEAEFREETIRRYGLEGKAGWLRPGQSEVDILALLGKPQSRSGRKLKWTTQADDYLWELQVDLTPKGNLLKTSGVKLASNVPVEGTLEWVHYWFRSDPSNKDPFSDAKPPHRPAPEKLAQTLMALSPEYSSASKRGYWADAVKSLADEGKHRDPALLDELLRRAVGSREELEALIAYDHSETSAWVAARLKELPTRPVDSGRPYGADTLQRDTSALLAYAFEHSRDEANRAAEVLIASQKNHWNEPLLSVCGVLTPAQQRRVVVQATDFALTEESASLAERIFDTVKAGSFDDPAAVKAAIEKFPAGNPESGWSKARQAALDHLNRVP